MDEMIAGRPVPTPPHEYVKSLPPSSVYACLYVRDEQHRPVQLRSVFTDRSWQCPGGNLDNVLEDPWDTALRETYEETGLRLDNGPAELLLTHFLYPEPSWPMSKIGFIFDGGTLDADTLASIRLDPEEHSEWAVHGWDTWKRKMSARGFARLQAIERARVGSGPRILLSGNAQTAPGPRPKSA